MQKTVTLRIKAKTRERLDGVKAPGQSYDGLLTEWLDRLEPILAKKIKREVKNAKK